MKNRKTLRKIAVSIMCIVLVFAAMTMAAAADGAYQPDASVAVFATDRHDNALIIGEIMAAVKEDGHAPGLFCLGGDMVGGGPDIEANTNYAPEVDSAFVQAEVHGALSRDVRVAILQASHDRNMTDSAGILVGEPKGFASGEFNVFIVPETYMADSAEAQKAAEVFEAWAGSNEVDANKPIIVLSHMPMHALRNDNLGGYVWHQALNSVAAGENGEIIRNVIFFHGHNHTADGEEYYHPVGTSLAIQGAADEEEYEEVINYTYITAGYLDQNGDATLLRVEEEQIVVDKYSADGGENLGTIARLKPVSESNVLIYVGAAVLALLVVGAAVILARRKSAQKQA